MNTAPLHIQSLCVAYGDQTVIENLDLHVEPGEMIALLGPSGCGKTTLLRTIAGLINQKSGTIHLGDRPIQDLPPQKRKTSLVFQNYALFPHMTVEQNVSYGLKIRNEGSSSIKQKTDEILAMVNLLDQKDKPVHEISGGQQQRVALARSLVIQPDLMLLDEPLSNLDEKLREKMRRDIRSLQQKMHVTSLYVTHDQNEAMAIADRIVVMDHGSIQQIDLPSVLYHYPNNVLVAQFMGHNNIFSTEEIKSMFPTLPLPEKKSTGKYLLPSEEVLLGKGPYQARVDGCELRGNTIYYQLKIAGHLLEAVSINRASQKIYELETSIHLDVEPSSLHILN